MRFRIERFLGTVRVMAGGCVSDAWDGGGLSWEDALSPETGLTKICIVAVGSGETEREDGDEDRIFVYLWCFLEGESCEMG